MRWRIKYKTFAEIVNWYQKEENRSGWKNQDSPSFHNDQETADVNEIHIF